MDLKRSDFKVKQESGVGSETLLISSSLRFSRLEERHASQIKVMSKESEELRTQLSQMEKELQCLHTELEAQKEANVRSPSNTMKNLVEHLKAQLAIKEKQLKVSDRMFWNKLMLPLCFLSLKEFYV